MKRAIRFITAIAVMFTLLISIVPANVYAGEEHGGGSDPNTGYNEGSDQGYTAGKFSDNAFFHTYLTDVRVAYKSGGEVKYKDIVRNGQITVSLLTVDEPSGTFIFPCLTIYLYFTSPTLLYDTCTSVM